MASKKDLVEAHQFSRRRLVSAFLSGAPGGREVEPPRPGRTVFGGVVLAVLLIAGGAVAHFLSPKAATDWAKQDGLVVTKGGSRYVVVGPDGKKGIYPVVNLTSAQLILGLDLSAKSQIIDEDVIADKRPKFTLGISTPTIPEELPTDKEFINSGWTACTADGAGTYVDISAHPAVHPGGGSGFLVKTDQSTYLIAEGLSKDGRQQAYSYDLKGQQDTFKGQIFSTGAPPPAITVPQAWVNLFDTGAPIDYSAFGIKDAGKPYTGNDAGGQNFVVGSMANYGTTNYVLTDKGWARADQFAFNVYETAASVSGEPAPTVTLSGPPTVRGGTLDLPTWPINKPNPAEGAACAKLVTSKNAPAYATLEINPGSHAWPTTNPPAPDSPKTVLVDAGKGAFVFAGSQADADPASGDPFIIDDHGQANKIDGDTTLATLGLTTKSGPMIPATWLLLLPNGPALSTEFALCPPNTTNVKGAKCAQPTQ